jgi:biopolymer transport protein ExbD
VAQFSLDAVSYPTADSMQGVLTTQHQQNPLASVVIRADRNVEYSNIADLMSACANAGVSTVTFAVMIGGNNKKRASAATPGGTASN